MVDRTNDECPPSFRAIRIIEETPENPRATLGRATGSGRASAVGGPGVRLRSGTGGVPAGRWLPGSTAPLFAARRSRRRNGVGSDLAQRAAVDAPLGGGDLA